MKKLLLVILLFVLFSQKNSIAQSNSKWMHMFKPEFVSDIDEDSTYLWVSTYRSGLVKINKKTDLVEYINKANSDLPFNEIHTFHLSSNGKIYIGGNYRFAVFDGSSWVEYNTLNSNIGNVGYLRDLEEDENGNIWFGSDFMGLHKFNGTNFTLVSGTSSSAICIDTSNTIWTADPYAMNIRAYNSNGTFSNGWSNLSNGCVPDAVVTCMKSNDSNEVWICACSSALGGYGSLTYFKNRVCNRLPDSIYTAFKFSQDISFDSSGSVYIATLDKGIFVYDGTSLDTLNKNSLGINTNSINKVYFDQENNMWFSSKDNLYRRKNNVINSFKLSQIEVPSNNWNSIYINSNNEKYLQYSTDIYSSLRRYYNYKIGMNDTVIFPAHDFYFDYAEDSLGCIWIGTTGGIIKLEDTTETFFPFPSTYSNYVRYVSSIEIGKNNEIWAGTNYGLFKFVNNSWPSVSFVTPNNSLNVSALYYDRGTDQLFAGFFDDYGPYVLNSSNQWTSLPYLSTSYRILKIFSDKNGSIWFISDKDGFIETDPMSINPIYHNVSNDHIRTACSDDNNIKYACSKYKFYKYDGSSWDTLSIYDSDYSLIEVYSMQADQYNNIWMVGMSGICIYNDNKVILNIGEVINQDNNIDFYIYPNPSTGIIQLYADKDYKNVEIEVISINGQMVYCQNKVAIVEGERIILNLNHLESGIYILNLKTEDVSTSKKIVIR